MKIVAIASQKGGVGKSTIAVHLAVAASNEGKNVIIVDIDPHSQTSSEWATERGIRGLDKPVVLQSHADEIKDLKKQAKKEGYDLMIIDCPPYVDDVVGTVTKLADFTLIPVQPRFPDMRTLLRVIEGVHKPYAVILNGCQAKINGIESSKTREARTLIEEANITICPHSIVRRESFADSLNSGASVHEFDLHGKSALEIDSIWRWLQEVY